MGMVDKTWSLLMMLQIITISTQEMAEKDGEKFLILAGMYLIAHHI